MRWTVSRVVDIRASPADVFDVISTVERYADYSPAIRKVGKAPDGSYHWLVSLAGIPVSWDGIVTRSDRPREFAWRSVRGLSNAGSFSLVPTAGGTMVTLRMSLDLPSGLGLGWLKPLLIQYVERVGNDILQAVKRQLERRPASGHG